jgi:AcrR family transcriptional regulator
MPARRGRRRSAALATADELWGAHPPKQARSVDVIQRIAIAGQELFAEREYDTVSVADIASAAGVSVGAFYTRFPSKEHLVVHLMRDVAEGVLAEMAREMSEQRLADCGPREVMRRYLAMMGRVFVQHRGLLRPATLIARQTQHAELRQFLRRFNDSAHGHVRTLLLARLAAIPHEIAITRIDAAVLWSSAAMREVLLYSEPVSSLSPRHTSLIEELTLGVAAYLTAPVAR